MANAISQVILLESLTIRCARWENPAGAGPLLAGTRVDRIPVTNVFHDLLRSAKADQVPLNARPSSSPATERDQAQWVYWPLSDKTARASRSNCKPWRRGRLWPALKAAGSEVIERRTCCCHCNGQPLHDIRGSNEVVCPGCRLVVRRCRGMRFCEPPG